MQKNKGAELLSKQVEKLGSYRAAAEALSVNVSDVYNWCNEGRVPKLEYASRIETKFKIKMASWLVQNDTE